MTPIVGVAELALISARKPEGQCPPRVIRLLERLQDLVQDYVRRATKLLDVSRLEAGNLQLEPTAVDFSNLVLSIIGRYEAEAAHQHCVIEHAIEAGINSVSDTLAVELPSQRVKLHLEPPFEAGILLMALLSLAAKGIGQSRNSLLRMPMATNVERPAMSGLR